MNLLERKEFLFKHVLTDGKQISFELISTICSKLNKGATERHLHFFGLAPSGRIDDKRAMLINHLISSGESTIGNPVQCAPKVKSSQKVPKKTKSTIKGKRLSQAKTTVGNPVQCFLNGNSIIL